MASGPASLQIRLTAGRPRARWAATLPRRIAAVALGSLLAAALLALGEGIVRLSCPSIGLQGTDQSLFSPEPGEALVAWRPGARGTSFGVEVEIDPLGCRSIVPASQRAADALDPRPTWLILGDSVAFGVGVRGEETFSGLLQAARPELRVRNAAVVAMNLAGYPATARRLLAADRAIRRITLCYCLNDLEPRPLVERRQVCEAGLLDPRSRHWLAEVLLDAARRNSKLYQVVKAGLSDASRRYFEWDRAAYVDLNASPQRLAPLEELSEIAREAGVAFDVVLLPYEYQLRNRRPEVWLPQDALSRWLAARGIAVRDLRHELLGTGQTSRDLYLFGDPMHLSAAGHVAVFRVGFLDAARGPDGGLARAEGSVPSPTSR